MISEFAALDLHARCYGSSIVVMPQVAPRVVRTRVSKLSQAG
jgi:hypothetical protein